MAYSKIYSVEKMFRGLGNYTSPSSLGQSYSGAINAAIQEAATSAGGCGTVILPGGQVYCDSPIVGYKKGIDIIGGGRISSTLVHEPAAANAPALLQLNTDSLTHTSPDTTLVATTLQNFTIAGFDTDFDPARATRHRKRAIETACISECRLINVYVKDWATGAANLGSEGRSLALRSRGKEFLRLTECSFTADDCIAIEANPKEPSIQIDSDSFNFRSLYLLPGAGGTAIDIAPNTVIRKFTAEDVIVAGGKNGIIWDDPTGDYTTDGTQFTIKNYRGEQQYDPTGCNIRIKRGTTGGHGRSYGVHLENINLNFASSGIDLGGTINSMLKNIMFLQGNATAQAALVAAGARAFRLADNCQFTSVENFYIPKNTGGTTLYDFGTQVIRNQQGPAPADGGSQLYQSFNAHVV